jgi:hypothetical protein
MHYGWPELARICAMLGTIHLFSSPSPIDCTPTVPYLGFWQGSVSRKMALKIISFCMGTSERRSEMAEMSLGKK